MSKLHELADLGQSIWLDYMHRDMLDSGELNQLRVIGVRGVTSNPAIFEKAIAQSDTYDNALRILAAEGKSPLDIYEALAVEDIQRACDVFADLYHQTDGLDGYVSLEVNPNLANDTEGTIKEARRLFAAVDRPNAYIKVPATPAGVPAIRQLTSEGININVTLIFAISAYEAVAEAYIAGLEEMAENGGDLSSVSSVASFFVSRVDGKVDKALDEMGVDDIRGAIGIANAKMAYQRFLEIFSGERWERLEEKGARLQRPLWGSTSTKDPAYPDTLYIDSLIGPHTINTVPPDTLEAFLDHGTVARTLDKNIDEARAQLQRLAELGIDLDEVTDQLLEEGVAKFIKPFDSLLETISAQRQKILAEGERRQRWETALGNYQDIVDKAREELAENQVLQRLWNKDYTLWSDKPDEISNRLGWLHSASEMQEKVPELEALADDLRNEGYTHALLLGMGGSSLAPEMFAHTFGPVPGYLNLSVLDSTDPAAISRHRAALDAKKTVFIVSSKSGSTVETISLFKYFYNWVSTFVGAGEVGQHFIAITDPGSKLADLADKYQFRATLLNDPNIGGRYSALSYFGLLPAALLGIDLRKLLQRAAAINGPENSQVGAGLGAVLGALAKAGRDKLTLILSPEIESFGNWVEQLIAESTGKSGKGILPIVGELPMDPEAYSNDRLFIYMPLQGGAGYDSQVARLAQSEHPLLTLPVDDLYDIGEHIVTWEVATAVASHILGVHPFNQPNVESAKVRGREIIANYKKTGSVSQLIPRVKVGGVSVHDVEVPAETPAEVLDHFLEYASAGDYIAVQAYVEPNEQTDVALQAFRNYLRDKSGVAVTIGYGPRFLHSTGQLHKGDRGNGLFIQLITAPLRDLPIPDEPGSNETSITFGALKMAQALGDAQALREAGRRVVRFQLNGNVPTLLPLLGRGPLLEPV